METSNKKSAGAWCVCSLCYTGFLAVREFAPINGIEYGPQLTSVGHRTIVSGSDARQST